jgi:hypothetical protein
MEGVLQKQSGRKGMHVYFIRHATTIEAANATAVVTTTRVFPSTACCAIAAIKAAKKATSVTMPTRTIVDRLFCSLIVFFAGAGIIRPIASTTEPGG